jgi:multidrug efflux pump subunit AcrB
LSCCSGWREESHLDRRVAKKQHDAGLSVYDATIAGAKQRFRPVLMTALAFIVRVFPLVVATGVGAGSRRALGTPVWGGW